MPTFRLDQKIDFFFNFIYFFCTHKFHYVQILLTALFLVDMEGGVSVSI